MGACARSLFGLLGALQQFLQFLLQNLVGPLLGLDVVLVGLLVGFLLFFVRCFHLADFGLQVVHLVV